MNGREVQIKYFLELLKNNIDEIYEVEGQRTFRPEFIDELGWIDSGVEFDKITFFLKRKKNVS